MVSQISALQPITKRAGLLPIEVEDDDAGDRLGDRKRLEWAAPLVAARHVTAAAGAGTGTSPGSKSPPALASRCV